MLREFARQIKRHIGSHLSQKLYGHQTFKVQGLKLMAPGYQVILSHDCKITWQIKKSNKDSDFYSTTVSLRLSNLARRRPTVNCEVTNYAKYSAEI